MPRATGSSPSSAGAPRPSCAGFPRAPRLSVPEGLSWEEAGGFPEAFYTAHDALFTQAGLLAGERVLVSGAAGGVGTAAVQLARAAGAHVVASVRNPDQHRAVADLGAAEVIVPEDVAKAGPYDVSLELVGAPGVTAALPALAIGARIVVIGVGAGATLELSLLSLMGARATLAGIHVAGPLLGREGRRRPGGRGPGASPPRRRHGAGPGGRPLPAFQGAGRLRAVCLGRQAREDRAHQRLSCRRPAD